MIHKKDIDRLAFPAMVSGIVEPIISLIDAAFVGRLGEAELGGVGLASSFFLLLVWMLAQTKSALTAAVAKHYGAEDIEGIKPLVPIAIWLNIGIGLLLLLLSLLFKDQIFEIYGAQGSLKEQAWDYYAIRSMGFPIVFANLMIFGAFRGFQNTSWPMWTSVLGGTVNLILDPLFIFGLPDLFPAMGVKGAALASLFAQVSMLIMAVTILQKRTPFSVIPKTWRHAETPGLLMLSGNLFIRTLAMNVAYLLGNRNATLLGDSHIAAHTITMNIWLFSAYFIDGYAEAGMVLAGKLKGEGKRRELTGLTHRIILYCIMIGAIISGVYALAYYHIGAIFSNEELVISLFESVFWIAIICQTINGLAFAMDGIYNGLAEGAAMRNVLVISTTLVFIPLVFLAQEYAWGLSGIWWAFLAWMLARGLPLYLHFRLRYGS